MLHFVNFPILLNGKVTRFYESLDHIPEPQSQCVALLHLGAQGQGQALCQQ